MRRMDRALSTEDAKLLLEECEHGVLSLVTPENKPYSVPVNHVYLPEENVIYIHCATEGRKLLCIAQNSDVQFTVVRNAEVIISRFTTLYESAIAVGTAVLIESPDEKRSALIKLCQKFEPETENNLDILEKTKLYIDKFLDKTAIIKINVSSVFGKANK